LTLNPGENKAETSSKKEEVEEPSKDQAGSDGINYIP